MIHVCTIWRLVPNIFLKKINLKVFMKHYAIIILMKFHIETSELVNRETRTSRNQPCANEVSQVDLYFAPVACFHPKKLHKQIRVVLHFWYKIIYTSPIIYTINIIWQ